MTKPRYSMQGAIGPRGIPTFSDEPLTEEELRRLRIEEARASRREQRPEGYMPWSFLEGDPPPHLNDRASGLLNEPFEYRGKKGTIFYRPTGREMVGEREVPALTHAERGYLDSLSSRGAPPRGPASRAPAPAPAPAPTVAPVAAPAPAPRIPQAPQQDSFEEMRRQYGDEALGYEPGELPPLRSLRNVQPAGIEDDTVPDLGYSPPTGPEFDTPLQEAVEVSQAKTDMVRLLGKTGLNQYAPMFSGFEDIERARQIEAAQVGPVQREASGEGFGRIMNAAPEEFRQWAAKKGKDPEEAWNELSLEDQKAEIYFNSPEFIEDQKRLLQTERRAGAKRRAAQILQNYEDKYGKGLWEDTKDMFSSGFNSLWEGGGAIGEAIVNLPETGKEVLDLAVAAGADPWFMQERKLKGEEVPEFYASAMEAVLGKDWEHVGLKPGDRTKIMALRFKNLGLEVGEGMAKTLGGLLVNFGAGGFAHVNELTGGKLGPSWSPTLQALEDNGWLDTTLKGSVRRAGGAALIVGSPYVAAAGTAGLARVAPSAAATLSKAQKTSAAMAAAVVPKAVRNAAASVARSLNKDLPTPGAAAEVLGFKGMVEKGPLVGESSITVQRAAPGSVTKTAQEVPQVLRAEKAAPQKPYVEPEADIFEGTPGRNSRAYNAVVEEGRRILEENPKAGAEEIATHLGIRMGSKAENLFRRERGADVVRKAYEDAKKAELRGQGTKVPEFPVTTTHGKALKAEADNLAADISKIDAELEALKATGTSGGAPKRNKIARLESQRDGLQQRASDLRGKMAKERVPGTTIDSPEGQPATARRARPFKGDAVPFTSKDLKRSGKESRQLKKGKRLLKESDDSIEKLDKEIALLKKYINREPDGAVKKAQEGALKDAEARKAQATQRRSQILTEMEDIEARRLPPGSPTPPKAAPSEQVAAALEADIDATPTDLTPEQASLVERINQRSRRRMKLTPDQKKLLEDYEAKIASTSTELTPDQKELVSAILKKRRRRLQLTPTEKNIVRAYEVRRRGRSADAVEGQDWAPLGKAEAPATPLGDLTRQLEADSPAPAAPATRVPAASETSQKGIFEAETEKLPDSDSPLVQAIEEAPVAPTPTPASGRKRLSAEEASSYTDPNKFTKRNTDAEVEFFREYLEANPKASLRKAYTAFLEEMEEITGVKISRERPIDPKTGKKKPSPFNNLVTNSTKSNRGTKNKHLDEFRGDDPGTTGPPAGAAPKTDDGGGSAAPGKPADPASLEGKGRNPREKPENKARDDHYGGALDSLGISRRKGEFGRARMGAGSYRTERNLVSELEGGPDGGNWTQMDSKGFLDSIQQHLTWLETRKYHPHEQATTPFEGALAGLDTPGAQTKLLELIAQRWEWDKGFRKSLLHYSNPSNKNRPTGTKGIVNFSSYANYDAGAGWRIANNIMEHVETAVSKAGSAEGTKAFLDYTAKGGGSARLKKGGSKGSTRGKTQAPPKSSTTKESPPSNEGDFKSGLHRDNAKLFKEIERGNNVGVALVKNINEPVRRALHNHIVDNDAHVFVDSGAYTSHNTGVPIKREYRKAAKGEKRRSWPEIFYQTKEIVGSLPNSKRRNVHVVAPDEVGEFEGTLDLYRDKELIKQFKEVQELGAEIIFPVQKSEGSTLLTNYRKMFRVLDKEGLALARTRRIHYGGSKKGWKETVKSDFSERTTLGIPYKKKTWKQAEIVQFFKDLEKAAGWIKNAEFRYNLDSGQKRLLRDLDKFKDSTRYLPTFNRIGSESEFIPDIHLLGGGPEKVAALKKALDKEGVPYGSIVGDATSEDVNRARFGTGEKRAKKKAKKKTTKKRPAQPGDVHHGERHPSSTWKGSMTLPEPGRRVGSPAPGPKKLDGLSRDELEAIAKEENVQGDSVFGTLLMSQSDLKKKILKNRKK